MQTAAKKITNYFLQIGLIEPYQSEWFSYILESRLITLFSLPILILLGCFIAPFKVVVTLNIGMLYLRPRINGFHSKTFLGCFIISIILELSSLVLIDCSTNFITWLTFVCSIFIIYFTAFGKMSCYVSQCSCFSFSYRKPWFWSSMRRNLI